MLKTLAALLFLVCQFGLVSSVHAEECITESFPAEKKHIVGPLEAVRGTLCIIGMAIEIDHGHELTVAAPIKPQDFEKIRQKRVSSLFIEVGADEHILDDPTLFSHLRSLELDSDLYNDFYLHLLSKYFPKIESLVVRQNRPLPSIASQYFSCFKKLKRLEIFCPDSAGAYRSNSNLKNLETFLVIDDRWQPTKSPKVRRLRIEECRLDQSFFANLDCPNLEEIDLAWVDLPKDSLDQLSRFKRLTDLTLYNVSLTDRDRQTLIAFKNLDRIIQTEPKRCTDFIQIADTYFKDRDYRKALGFYEAVFTAPSVEGYIKRAQCHIKLKETEMVLRQCEYASAMVLNLDDADVLATVRERAKNCATQRFRNKQWSQPCKTAQAT